MAKSLVQQAVTLALTMSPVERAEAARIVEVMAPGRRKKRRGGKRGKRKAKAAPAPEAAYPKVVKPAKKKAPTKKKAKPAPVEETSTESDN